MATSYGDYVSNMAIHNPSLKALSDFLGRQPRTICNSIVSCVEVEGADGVGQPRQISTSEIMAEINRGLAKSVVAVVENIHPEDIDILGSGLDIDPFFFCGHITSSYRDIENTPPPPLLALPPSQITSRAFFNIHYQKVLDLGSELALINAPYDFVLSSNVARSVRRLPALSGRSVGFLRACSSVIKHNLPNNLWICIVLVDPAADIVVHSTHHHFIETRIPQVPRRIGIEGFSDLPSYTAYQAAGAANENNQPHNPREELLNFLHTCPPGWKGGKPSVLSLAYYPIRSIVREWMLYGLLMSRYIKYYEYSFPNVQSRLEHFEKIDILDLHRWRRRSLQTLHKLRMTRSFVEHWRGKEDCNKDSEATGERGAASGELFTWNQLVMDLRYLEEQIDQHHRSLEALNPIITALVQLIDSHKSISQAEDVRRLTYIAMAFIPLTYITGIFSMSEPYGPGGDRFWVYWVAAVPTAALIMALLVLENRIPALSAFFERIKNLGRG